MMKFTLNIKDEVTPVKVTTEEFERCEVLLTVEIEPQQERDLLQKAAKRIARQMKIPGFRPGKAPYNVVVRRFGLEAVQQEALEKSADKMIQKALEDANVTPYAQIELDEIAWDPLTIKIKVPTPPIVELENYQEIRLEATAVEVTEEDIEQALERMQEETAMWAPVEHPAEIGHLVSMAVVEKEGDEILAEHESIEHELTPAEAHEGHNHPDLTTPLLGLSAGDEKTFTITYPDDFDSDRYAGKDITFEVEILSIKEKEVDPLDDELAKSVSDFETLEELKADIEKTIRDQREKQNNLDLGNKVLDQIIEEGRIEWPLALEEARVDQEIKRYERQMETYGLSMENYLQVQNKTNEEFLEETRAEIIKRLKRGLVLSKVAELEQLDVSESEILAQAKLISDLSGKGDQLWRDILASETQQNIIANDLLFEKALQQLAASAKGENSRVEPASELNETANADDEASETEDDAPDTNIDQDQSEAEPAEAPAIVKAE
jgi:trigger factor